MITNITEELFNAIIPTTIDPTGQIFQYCTVAMEEAEEELINTYFSAEVITECVNHMQVNNTVTRFIALRGFVDTIPMMDLGLTPNGFAVTSTQQLSPASRDRVDALKKMCYHLSFVALNNLISQILTTSELFELWIKAKSPKEVIKHFFWRTKDICFIFAMNEKDYEEDSTIGDLYRIDAMVAPYLSTDLLAHLWDVVANHKESQSEKTLLLILRRTYAAIQRNTPVYLAVGDAMTFINTKIDDFPSFKDSELYKSSANSKYPNTDEKVFYFG